MVIYVHANIVERQLQSMLYIDRVSTLSSSRMKMDCFVGKISDGRKSVGRARVFQDSERNKDTGGLERSSLERKRRQGVQLVPLRHATMLTKLHTNFIIVCTASVSLITSLASLM